MVDDRLRERGEHLRRRRITPGMNRYRLLAIDELSRHHAAPPALCAEPQPTLRPPGSAAKGALCRDHKVYATTLLSRWKTLLAFGAALIPLRLRRPARRPRWRQQRARLAYGARPGRLRARCRAAIRRRRRRLERGVFHAALLRRPADGGVAARGSLAGAALRRHPGHAGLPRVATVRRDHRPLEAPLSGTSIPKHQRLARFPPGPPIISNVAGSGRARRRRRARASTATARDTLLLPALRLLRFRSSRTARQPTTASSPLQPCLFTPVLLHVLNPSFSSERRIPTRERVDSRRPCPAAFRVRACVRVSRRGGCTKQLCSAPARRRLRDLRRADDLARARLGDHIVHARGGPRGDAPTFQQTTALWQTLMRDHRSTCSPTPNSDTGTFRCGSAGLCAASPTCRAQANHPRTSQSALRHRFERNPTSCRARTR